MTRRNVAVVLAAACLTLSACGGGGSSGSGPPSPSAGHSAAASKNMTASAARKVLEDYNAEFVGGDMKAACALLTPEYQKFTIARATDFNGGNAPADCEAALKGILVFAKRFGYDEATSKVSDATVSGDTATVLEESEPPFDDTLYTLAWDGAHWLIAGEKSAAAKADPERWLANWCAVKPGMTVDQAVSLMGDFTSDFRGDNKTKPRVEWSERAYRFTAVLDTDGKIVQLVTNDMKLRATDKTKLTCESTRR